MLRPLHAVAALLTLSLAASCHSRRGTPGSRPDFSCGNFRVPTRELLLNAKGGLYPLGDVTLLVPAGAVADTVRLRVRRGTRRGTSSAAVELTGPAGASVAFAEPVTISMYYGDCKNPQRPRDVYRVDRGMNEPIPFTRDSAARVVTFSRDSLSEYAMGDP